MSGRKLSALEQRLHQAALADPKKTLTQKECEALIPDQSSRMAAINFLLGTGLLKAMKDTKGVLSFRAVMKKEIEVKKDMSGEESMVLSHIQAAGNEGIWTKHLKAKTELHQTVIDRCIKSLTQKHLIKAVKSVKYPTRKIYMLAHLEPSVEMTGGPWYTDNELDTEFIKLLCSACLRFIRDRSLPKQKGSDSQSDARLLYPISAAPSYPTAQQILTFLGKSRITETQLNVEHVEMLLNVLVLDGEIEKVPAFGAAMWDTNALDEKPDESEDEREGKKRKRKDKDGASRKRKRSKRSRSFDSGSASESESDSETSERKSKSKRQKKSKESDEESDTEEKRRRKKRRHDESGSDTDASEIEEKSRRKKSSKSSSRSKSKSKKRRHESSESESDTASSGSDSEDDDRRSRSKSKSSSRSKSTSKMRQRSSSPVGDLSMGMEAGEDYGAYVYRAIQQERVAGGLTQAPCMRCPTFDFCKTGGPVNAKECVYYGEWLTAASVARE
ncbi:hypothetical protein WOLCODRAFT_140917 [Wolfiporia cocos MD-104 SS10]|uniref:DNA-directed RNA polymerase III subunit RPC6 n=1 Tax=Wolfiporia cocos (strain MD-104) TaxID=742152 RepID=A0A2H3J5M1_WOLCO|nr:hypothetical protein WOLCODRAFT_140917 [Wolfiporia cocos MD-104 SS10]